MLSSIAYAVWLGHVCLGQVPLDRSGERGTVHVVAVDPFGNTLTAPAITFLKLDGKATSVVSSAKAEVNLEYGDYLVRVTQPGFETVSRNIRVERQDLWLVVGLPIGSLEGIGTQTVTRGHVVGLKKESSTCDIVRFVSVFLLRPPEGTRLSSDGYFTFDNLKPGEYLAVLFGTSGICGTWRVTVLNRSLQEIVLDTAKGML